jgi:hypothetical protein
MANKKPTKFPKRKIGKTPTKVKPLTPSTTAALDRIEGDKQLLCYRHSLPSDSELHEMVRELKYRAGYGTSPDNPNSMSEKDVNAFRVFMLAGQLIGPLLKWAINHEKGKILADIDSYDEWTPQILEDPNLKTKTSIRNLAANSHDNERRGAGYSGNEPIINQKLAAVVMSALSAGMKFDAGKAVAGALTALKFGDVYAELRPTKTNRKHMSSLLDRAKLIAIQHVEFRRGAGSTRIDAVNLVASSFGVTADALKKWQKNNFAYLPSLDPANALKLCNTARIIGQACAAIEDRPLRPKLPNFIPPLDLDNEPTQARIKLMADRYSDVAMETHAHNYKKLAYAAKAKTG